MPSAILSARLRRARSASAFSASTSLAVFAWVFFARSSFRLAYGPPRPMTTPVISKTSSKKYSRTGCVNPGTCTRAVATPPTPRVTAAGPGVAKYASNKSASAVADMSTTFRFGFLASASRSNRSNRSESTERSCTSSSTTWVTRVSEGSESILRSNTPAVQNKRRVRRLRRDSSRTE